MSKIRDLALVLGTAAAIAVTGTAGVATAQPSDQTAAGTKWRWYGEYNTKAGCEHTGKTLVAQRKALNYRCYWEPFEWDLDILVWA
ncbi:hypothetical protein [Amycolatopsis sp. lyj-108]|uniref:hypothetical protein n=1 Tax=Amycolatopsis sp. lyj-108 TaxID=2789286 RepID=UPI003979E445